MDTRRIIVIERKSLLAILFIWIRLIFFRTADLKQDLPGERRLAKLLDGKIMASLFYEPSTRNPQLISLSAGFNTVLLTARS